MALLSAPFVLLFVVLLAVKSAHSSSAFRIDNEIILQNLKAQLAAAAASSRPTDLVEDAAAAAHASLPAELREVREVVRKGDTLGGVLRRVGISSSEVTRWSATAHRHVSLSRLQTGHKFTFLVPSGTDRLAGLQYEVSTESTLVMREDGSEITAQLERLPRSTEVRMVSGTIESSLYAAATRRGVPDSVISGMVDIFGWEVDFSSDLQEGDTFRIAYEATRDLDGTVTGGRVVAAELETGGRKLEAVYFEADDESGGGYYTPEGRSFGRAFLKYPLEFTKITSQFASSRFHPLLGIHRPHLGVDFAAPIGTPVRAIATGRVEYAGWKGGSGRFIKVDHGSGLESSYSHLNAIVPGVRNGSRVQVGQVIGYVGATGLATGPHLHFALYREGVYVNPMTVKLPAAPPLPSKYMAEFAEVRDQVLRQLASAPLDGAPGELRVASLAHRD